MSKRSLNHDAPPAPSTTSRPPKRPKDGEQAHSDEQDSFDEDVVRFDVVSRKGRRQGGRREAECYSDSYSEESEEEAHRISIDHTDEEANDDHESAEASPQLVDVKMMPFNMREEEAEGSFDAEGTFIPARDEHAHLDRWLEHTSIYRPPASAERHVAVGRGIERVSEEDAQRELAALTGTHTPLEAIRLRAPAPLSAAARRRGLRVQHADPAARREIDKITELCSILMDDYGHTDIYEHILSNKDGTA